MSSYISLYLDAFGYCIGEYIPSELSGESAMDIHHIEARGMGGDPKKKKHRIENLMALTREEHIKYGDKTKYMAFLFEKHKSFLLRHSIKFDEKYLDKKIAEYE